MSEDHREHGSHHDDENTQGQGSEQYDEYTFDDTAPDILGGIMQFDTDNPNLSPEALEHEEQLEDATCTLHLMMPENPEELRSYLATVIMELQQKFPGLHSKDIERVLLRRLTYDMGVALLIAEIANDIIQEVLHDLKIGNLPTTIPPQMAEMLASYLQVLEILQKETIEEILASKTHVTTEEDDGGGESDEPVKDDTEAPTATRVGATYARRSQAGKNEEQLHYTSSSSRNLHTTLKRGTVTRDMDVELDTVSRIFGRPSHELNKDALRRVMLEWSFDQFNKHPDLLKIAFYLLAYFFHVPPFFDGIDNRIRLTDRDIQAFGIADFLKKSRAINFQEPTLDPMLKVYHTRFMDKAGFAIIEGSFTADRTPPDLTRTNKPRSEVQKQTSSQNNTSPHHPDDTSISEVFTSLVA